MNVFPIQFMEVIGIIKMLPITEFDIKRLPGTYKNHNLKKVDRSYRLANLCGYGRCGYMVCRPKRPNLVIPAINISGSAVYPDIRKILASGPSMKDNTGGWKIR